MRSTPVPIDTRAMNVIEVSNLVKRYGDRTAVDGVSFSVEEGEIFAILGPNGAGKTTTVESIGGLRSPDSGTIRVLGLDPRRDRDRLLEDLGLADKRKAQFGKLSGGERQRLAIALALIGKPRIAILDELTTGLDPQARRDTWQLIEDIRREGVTVILVTHFMEEAERLADRIALIDQGALVALDTPAGIVSRVDTEQRLRFRPSGPIDDGLLSGLPGVRTVTRDGSTIVVSGTGNLVQSVMAALARHQIVANDLRIDQADLDDAFVALTGRKLAS